MIQGLIMKAAFIGSDRIRTRSSKSNPIRGHTSHVYIQANTSTDHDAGKFQGSQLVNNKNNLPDTVSTGTGCTPAK